MSHASPDIRDYYIGKGVISFKKTGDIDFRDIGNCPDFEFTPTVTTLDHFSSRTGVKTKDRTVTTEKTAEIKMTMEEFTVQNMAIALLGDVSTNTAGREVIDILAKSTIDGELKFVGTNEIGPRFEMHFPSVSFIPNGSISFISDTWGTLTVTATVNADSTTGSFGTATDIGEEDSE